MPDIVPTVGASNANSYASLDAAVEYVDARVGGATWTDLDEDDQIRTLLSATIDLDMLAPYFPDAKTDVSQALEWPRSGANVLPPNLVRACIELAMSYAPAAADGTDPLAPDNPGARGIKREKIGALETEYMAPVTTRNGVTFFTPDDTSNGDPSPLSRFPGVVQRLLAPLIEWSTTPTSLGWGTGTSRRAT